MRVCELSEDDLLARIVPLLPRAANIEIASGDDCAVLRLDGPRVAVSTDMLVEGRHFTRQWSSGYDVGWRSATQNLADAVAMGARPLSLLACLELPGDLPVAWVEDFARGMGQAARAAGCGVDGGDLTSGPAICIGVTVIGDLEGRPANTRAEAKAGQRLVHCGNLGFSAAGYELLASGRAAATGRDNVAAGQASSGKLDELLAAFLRPNPPLDVALAACRSGQLGALMDVSDGLVRDGRRMANASGVWIDLDPHALGTHITLLEGCGFDRAKATELVLSGGEDHGFLATVSGEVPAGFEAIGTIREQADGGRVTLGGQDIEGMGGWDHFAASGQGE